MQYLALVGVFEPTMHTLACELLFARRLEG